ncbi:MAG: hypothetical protein LUC43_04800 [Burkholderiales bacterium]|nr:hypothetical protein [Burkholderiales bacterium]
MYIHYQTANGVEYAVLAKSLRKGKKVIRKSVNLGRVIDKNKKIFRNRERGYFVYDLATNTYSVPPKDFDAPKSLERRKSVPPSTLHFGSTFVLHSLCEKYGIADIVRHDLGVANPDSFLALLYYYILSKDANSYAELWYEGNYVRYLLPHAKLDSTEVNALLEEAGNEYIKDRFFKAYLDLFPELKQGEAVLIDTMGLPNASHFPLVCLRTKNGMTAMIAKVAYVTKVESKLPVFYQPNLDCISDKTVFRNLLEDISAYDMDIKEAVVDVDCSSLEKLKEYFDIGSDILLRLSPNLKLYKEAVLEASPELELDTNCVVRPKKILYIAEVERMIKARKVYLYVGLDLNERVVQSIYLVTPKNGKLDAFEVSHKLKESGKFVILSTRRLQKNDVVAFYLKRFETEQLFEVEKNYVKALPQTIQSEEAFKGHLLLSFIGTVVKALIDQQLKKSAIHNDTQVIKEECVEKCSEEAPELNRIDMFKHLDNQGCICYGRKLIPDVPNKPINEIYKSLYIDSPKQIQIGKNGQLKVVEKN